MIRKPMTAVRLEDPVHADLTALKIAQSTRLGYIPTFSDLIAALVVMGLADPAQLTETIRQVRPQ